MKFSSFYSIFVGHFALLDPDSESGYGSTDLTESGSNPDPDPKHCTEYCTRRRRIFTGLSQDGGRAYFSKNLRASLFKKYLSNEPNYSWIQYQEIKKLRSRNAISIKSMQKN
jgi:hypothetical protein